MDIACNVPHTSRYLGIQLRTLTPSSTPSIGTRVRSFAHRLEGIGQALRIMKAGSWGGLLVQGETTEVEVKRPLWAEVHRPVGKNIIIVRFVAIKHSKGVSHILERLFSTAWFRCESVFFFHYW